MIIPSFELHFRYMPRKGHVIWLTGCRRGKRAGSGYHSGYRYIFFQGRTYLEHRVCWYLKTGTWPAHDIDHRDLDRANNKWKNIRAATDSQNHANKPISKNNTSGYKGVSWHSHYRKWAASIEVMGKAKWLGAHARIEDAAAAYATAALHYFGEFARVK